MERKTLALFIARRLRQIRIEQGLSQQALEKSGVNPKYYQRIEAGSVNLTLRSLEKLAAALGIEPLEIFQRCGAKGTRKTKT